MAAELGHETLTIDINPAFEPDVTMDVLDYRKSRITPIFDVIWASPPCTGFSVASIGTHWGGGKGKYEPKTETAKLGIALVKKTLEIIAFYKTLNPNLIWFIENPRGVLRKMPFMDRAGVRHTVSYCQYGDDRMKPTDIWTNSFWWRPKKMCKNGDPCHQAAPRGSKTGTQGKGSAYERGKIPRELFVEIFKAIN